MMFFAIDLTWAQSFSARASWVSSKKIQLKLATGFFLNPAMTDFYLSQNIIQPLLQIVYTLSVNDNNRNEFVALADNYKSVHQEFNFWKKSLERSKK